MAELVTLPGLKTRFVAGLNWRYAANKPSRSELRELSEVAGRWGVVHITTQAKNDKSGAGIGTCDVIEGLTGKPRGLRSLAATVAEQLPQPWINVFELGNDRYWLVAVRDHGFVVPGGDVIGGRDEVWSHRDMLYQSLDWKDVSVSFDDLVDMARSGAKVPPLADLQQNPWMPLFWAGGAAAAALGGLGAVAYIQHQRALDAQQVQHERTLALRVARQASAEKDARILPWVGEPMPAEAIRACQLAWHTLSLARKGWVAKSWECEPGASAVSVQTHWMRQGGLAIDAPGALLAGGEESIERSSMPFSFADPVPLALETAPAERAVRTVAQTYGVDLKLTTNATPPVVKNGVTVPRVWGSSSAQFQLPAAPWTLAVGRGMGALPGLRLRSISWTSSKDTWAVNGVLYSMLDSLPGDESGVPRAHPGAPRALTARASKAGNDSIGPWATNSASVRTGQAPVKSAEARGGWGDAALGAQLGAPARAVASTPSNGWDAPSGSLPGRSSAAGTPTTGINVQPLAEAATSLSGGGWDDNGPSIASAIAPQKAIQPGSTTEPANSASAPVAPIAVPGLSGDALGGKS